VIFKKLLVRLLSFVPIILFYRFAMTVVATTPENDDKVAKVAKVAKPVKPTKNPATGKPARNKTSNEETRTKMFQFLCEQHTFGLTQVSKLELAIRVGYKNPRSATFAHTLKGLVTDGLIGKGYTKDTLCLTPEGIAQKPAQPAPQNLSELHNCYIQFLEKKVTLGKAKVRPAWQLLANGEAKEIQQLAKELGYNNPRSFANTKIIAAMKEINVLENAGNGMVKMTAKALPAHLFNPTSCELTGGESAPMESAPMESAPMESAPMVVESSQQFTELPVLSIAV
jgi:AraC-like DNA-binding protein